MRRIFLLLFIFSLSGFAQETSKKYSKSNDTINFFLKTEFKINGIPTNDKFDYDRYIEVLGKPDLEKRGGPEIIAEFGCDDFRLMFSENQIIAGLCYLSDAYITEKGININGLEIGDHRKKVESVFEIETKDKKEVWIWGNSLLIIYFDSNNHIYEMHLSQKVT
ncbi:hypothetical protein LB450_06505 [Psychroflexus sp. CAK1W]|uniref:hypothetical protein n=1 Tax=Psychroflexus curvus TaxID=2873595 RepID=UPI001CCD09C5|nr:hypothetical protein [Psychroflexus curvus]MBZ9627748.1 hypothetical protein [Psychroflexus curvus]